VTDLLRSPTVTPRCYRLARSLPGRLPPGIGIDDPALSKGSFVVLIEVPGHAVRLGFTDPYGFIHTIVETSTCRSHNYCNAATALTPTDTAVDPMGYARGTRIGRELVDGSEVPAIDSRGNVRANILPRIVSNRGNAAGPYTIGRFDFSPCISVARVDGNPLHFIYVALGETDLVCGQRGFAPSTGISRPAAGRHSTPGGLTHWEGTSRIVCKAHDGARLASPRSHRRYGCGT
jgi:hypothetical protein